MSLHRLSPHLRVARRALLATTLAGVALASAACSSGSATPPTTSTAAATPTTSAASATTLGPSSPTTQGASGGAAVAGIAPIPVADRSPAGTFGTRPTVTVPSGSAPSTLEAWDLIVGTGATATAGDDVTVQYDGYSWTYKKEFDASWNRGQPFSFTLGVGQVIKGWDEGVVGMKVGGRRELIIPPSLGYGAEAPSSAIAPNDTLIFVVDLVSVGSSAG